MLHESQLALMDVLDSMKRTKRNRIIVCLHATAAKNYLQQFVRLCRSAGLPFDITSEGVIEVRSLNQWQRVYFVSAYQHPDHYRHRAAEVFLMPGIEGAVQSVSWRNYAENVNKEWAK